MLTKTKIQSFRVRKAAKPPSKPSNPGITATEEDLVRSMNEIIITEDFPILQFLEKAQLSQKKI